MIEYYIVKKDGFKTYLKKIKTQLNWISGIRFAVFCITVFFLYFFLGDVTSMIISAILGSIVFLFFINKYLHLKKEKIILQKLISINSTEIDCLHGNYNHLEKGEEFINPHHFYSYDIDLFGKGSFFQFINRTSTELGKIKLAKILISNHIEDIKTKQEILEELAKKVDWRQKFNATANLIKVITPIDLTLKWIENYTVSLPKITCLISNLFSIITLCILIGIYFDFLVFTHLTIWIFIGLGISGFYFKKVTKIYENSTKARAIFNQYYRLLALIEKENYTSIILTQKKEILNTETKTASKIFKKFSMILDALDQRNNLFFGFIGNSLFLWDMRQASKIEKWISLYKKNVREWFEIVTFFDAQNSLANFKFNHPKFVFPKIINNKNIIKASKIGHPLLSHSKRITNDFIIDNQSFFIITGSNMAGKSTFLRTISLNIVMANIGLPVCAATMEYKPIKLITSMRTSDSLTDNTSYFFAELKRLKFIVESLKNERYFILLDEILKGTNSTDKAKGSQKFVEKLIDLKATGIIATHDLSLCNIADKYSNIQNHYFDAEITDNELSFDYTLKKGVCQNMNASFLLKKMEII